ncbi:MAG: glycosyltransferase [Thermoplasmata archaeon]|nr:glycosyltransferase [Thermoplasmata archaeon]
MGHDTIGLSAPGAPSTPGNATSGFSLIIPAWNEEVRLMKTLRRYIPVLLARGAPTELIIVTDGSQDRTAEVAAGWSDSGVRVVRADNRLGKGGAIRAGIQVARFDRVGFVDADGPVPPEEVIAMFRELDNFDCVVGSRWLPKSRVVTPQPLLRRAFSRAWNLLVRATLGMPLSDTQCGAKVFRRATVEHALPNMVVTNWAFDIDLLQQIRNSGATTSEFPVTWSDDADSRLVISRAVPAMMMALLSVRLRTKPLARRIPQTWRDWYRERWVAG